MAEVCEKDPCDPKADPSLAVALLANATPVATDTAPDDCELDRDFRMRSLFPRRVIGDDEDSPEPFISRFLDALDAEANAMFHRVDCFPTIADPLRCPAPLLDQLLYHLGNPFILEEGMPADRKRMLALSLFTIYALKGTCYAIIGAVRLIYRVEVTECVQPNIECWILGIDTLNQTAILCPSTAAGRRSFSIMVHRNLTDTERAQIRNVVNYLKPANTHFIRIIEPGSPGHVAHWVLRKSKLNLNAFLH